MRAEKRWPGSGDSPGPKGLATFEGPFDSRIVPLAQIVRAEIIGDQAIALGHSASGYAPVCQLARELIRAGFDPELPIEAFRDGVLALRCRSRAAGLTVENCSDGRPRFRAYVPSPGSEVRSPVAKNAATLPAPPPGPKNAPTERPAVRRGRNGG